MSFRDNLPQCLVSETKTLRVETNVVITLTEDILRRAFELPDDADITFTMPSGYGADDVILIHDHPEALQAS